MPETLLSPSNILLYGRVLTDLQFTFQHPNAQPPGSKAPPPQRQSANQLLQDQLQAANVVFARIYAFSYEGRYYDLPKPAIFVVHGAGDDPEEPRPAAPDDRLMRAPADADRTGVAATADSFSEDIRVWTYDKGDFSIRMDVETGPFEQILLEAVLRSDQSRSFYSGMDLRVSGMDLRVSGMDLRSRGGRGGGRD
ncbi:MAG: hypothetical protein ACREH6_09520 [Geminicoccaceae bacterium]